jgi:hypothetical protein
VLPAFQQRLEDIALIELGIAHQGDHAAFRQVPGQIRGRPGFEAHVVLHQAGEARHGHAEADGAGGEVHVVAVLGARGIGLGAAEGAEALQLVPGLLAQQILNGMEHGARVGLHGNPVLRPQHVEIKRRHQGDQGGAGGLVAADLQAVPAFPQVVGVVDDPGGEPEDLLLQRLEAGQTLRCNRAAFHPTGHPTGRTPGRTPGRFRFRHSANLMLFGSIVQLTHGAATIFIGSPS